MHAAIAGPSVMYLYQQLSGCTYWRVLAPAQALIAQGYPVRGFPVTDDRAFEVSHQVQAVVLTRLSWVPDDWLAGVRWVASLKERGLTVIYETDDDIFSEAWFPQGQIMEPHKSREVLDSNRVQRVKALQLCDGCLVTTPRLATLTREYTDKPVVVVPNAIDWPAWQAQCRQGRRPVEGHLLIGWAGGKRDEADLRPMAEAWRRIAARYPHVHFALVGYQAPCILAAIPPERAHVADWLPIDLYPAAYAGWDIGCCPLEDKPFNWYKSAIKAYEYAAAGAAVVYSKPVYGREMRDRLDGLQATTADEWEAALARLVEDAPFRAGLARSWARRVVERYSLQANLWRWPAAWQSIVSQTRKAKGAA